MSTPYFNTVREAPAAVPLRAGMLIELTKQGWAQPHSTPGGKHERMFVLPQQELYQVGEQVPYVIARRQSEVSVLLRAGEVVGVASYLVSGGDGTLVNDSRVPTAQEYAAFVLEAADLTGGDDTLIQARVFPKEGD